MACLRLVAVPDDVFPISVFLEYRGNILDLILAPWKRVYVFSNSAGVDQLSGSKTDDLHAAQAASIQVGNSIS